MALPLGNLWQQFQDLLPKTSLSIVRVIDLDYDNRRILGDYIDGTGQIWVTDRLHTGDWNPPATGKYLYIQDGEIFGEAPSYSIVYFEV